MHLLSETVRHEGRKPETVGGEANEDALVEQNCGALLWRVDLREWKRSNIRHRHNIRDDGKCLE